MKYTQTANAYYKSTSSNSYTSGSTGGYVKVSGYYMSSATAVASGSNGGSASSNTANYGCAYDTTVTLTATAKSGYRFVGWYSSTSASSATSTNATYTYNVKEEKTYYARFIKTQNITVQTATGGTITVPSGGSYSNVDVGTAKTITVTKSSGYEFAGWTITSGSGSIASASSLSTTITPTGGSDVTVKANFTAQKCSITPKKNNSSGSTLTAETLTIGNNLTVYAAGNEFHTSGNYTVTTSDSNVAGLSASSVAKNGTFQVKAKAVGTATISLRCATDSSDTASFTVTVNKSNLAVTFSSDDGTFVLVGDNTQTVSATASPTPSSVSWSSSSTSVATVSSTGAITPKAAGQTTITATATFANGGTDTATKVIKVETPKLTVSTNSLSMHYTESSSSAGSDYKGTDTFTVNTDANHPAYQNVTNVTVTSSNTSIVTVSPATISNATTSSAETVTVTSCATGSASVYVKYFINGTEVTSLRKTISVTVSAYDVNTVIYATGSTTYWNSNCYFIPSSGSGGTKMIIIGTSSNKPVYALQITKKQFSDGFYFGTAAATSTASNHNTQKITGNDYTKNLYTITDTSAWFQCTVTKSTIELYKPVLTKANETVNVGATKTAVVPTNSATGSPSSYVWTTAGAHSSYTANTSSGTPTISGSSVGNDSATVSGIIPLENSGITFSSLSISEASKPYIMGNTANFTIQVKNVAFTLTGITNPASNCGTVTFYSDSNCTTQITSAYYNNTVYAKYTPPSSAYTINGFAITSGTATLGTRNGNVVPVTMGTTNITVRANVIATTPTLSSVSIKNKDLSYGSYSNNGTLDYIYYLQPVTAKATTDSFSTLSYYTYKDNTGTTQHASQTGKASDTEVSLESCPDIIPKSENGEAEFRFIVVATNAPTGVASATKTINVTIKVKFNNTQKAYYRLKTLWDKSLEESTTNNPYYNVDAPITAYNTAYNSAKTYIQSGYPAYNADNTPSNLTTANNHYNTFKTAYDALALYAKKTTVYVLTKYAYNANNPIRLHVWGNGTEVDWQHFEMFCFNTDARVKQNDGDQNGDTYNMTYDGKFTKNGNRYRYKFTFTGHINYIVWRATSSTDYQMDGGDKITGDVPNATNAAYGEYYINAYNTSVGSTSITSAVAYNDFDHSSDSGKKLLELNASRTKDQLVSGSSSLFNIAPTGSMVASSPGPGIDTANTAMTIEGPIGKSTSRIYDFVNTTSSNYVTSFPADKQGKYRLLYTTRFGYDANNNPITRTIEKTLWVAADDIDVYVDMNDNVGTPILNFKYYVNSQGDPVVSGTSGATEAYLPYEMDLATGSESVYKYTIKVSKLKTDYKIPFDVNQPINISYITVENTKIGQSNGGFNIDVEARITGEVWYKANSTKLTTFNNISYGSVNKSFMAVDSNDHYLLNAIKSVHGTGIVTDDEISQTVSGTTYEGELYNAQYATLYTLDGASSILNKFGYNLRTVAKEEIVVGSTTYYFDKWVKQTGSGTTDYSTSPDLNFNSAVDYNDGNCDETYIAKYKQATSSDSTVRVVVTYNFEDYDTSDGNYIYDAAKPTVDASYTKTIKVKVGSGQTYSNFAAVSNAVDTIARVNSPVIKSNYFDYTYTNGSANIDESNSNQSKIVATASFTKSPREYRIIVKDGSNVASNTTGYYQQTIELTNNKTNPVWKDSSDKIIATGGTYIARYVSSGNEVNDSTDCQILKVASQSGASVNNTSVISNSYTEQYYEGDTKMLKHNFYIIDYCAEGKLVGGGVLFATTDSSGNYRQSNAATQLASKATRKSFIEGILSGDFTTEYKPQTIDNIGFRYKPFKSTEDVYRYSDDIGAYITTYEGTNVNNPSYSGQKLRVFSFMVYDNNGTSVVVPSEGYAQVERYISGS